MNLDLMRSIDYYVGILICFFLTIFDKIFGSFILRRKENKQKNILFIQLAEMGSTILAYSSFKKIKEIYPDSNLFFLVFHKNRYCIEYLNVIKKENILTIREDSFSVFALDTFKVLLKLRRKKIDICFDFEFFSRFSSIVSYLSGAIRRVGFYNYYHEGLYRGNMLTHKVYYNHYQHMVLNFLSMIHSVRYSGKEDYLLKEKISEKEIILPEIKITEESKKNIWNKLKELNPKINSDKKLVVINPYAGELLPIRSWPIDNYINLIRKLLDDKNIFIILTGGNDSKKWQNKILNEISSNRIITLVGKTTFSELIDLYNISDVLITNDSGPVHFASLTPIKIFVFFGPGGLIYKPLSKTAKVFYSGLSCSPCLTDLNHGETSCKDNKCLRTISPEEVYMEISNYLNKK